MLAKWFSKSTRVTRKVAAAAAAEARPAAAACEVEPLEPRQFLSAALKVENLDIIPGYERLIFNQIGQKNTTYPNYVKDKGVVRLTNTGDQTLSFSNVVISGPFKAVTPLPSSLGPGKSVNVTLQFTATKPPPYTYNQTSYTTKPYSGGTYIGSLTFKTNDPNNGTYKEELAGYYQNKSEDNQEPGLQTIVNLVMNYKTNIAPPKTVDLKQTSTSRVLYGEEIASAYWTVADSARPVGMRQIAAFKGMDFPVSSGWYKKSDKVYKQLYKNDVRTNQSFLPYKEGQPGVAANGTFSPGAGVVFGFKVDREWSDDKLNKKPWGQGHHMRFWPLRDHFGNILPNTYLMSMDYSDAYAVPNEDYQDNVYIISNVKPAGN